MEFVDILAQTNEIYLRELENKGIQVHAELRKTTQALIDIQSCLA